MNTEQRSGETGADERAAVVQGLRELADFLDLNPSAPVPTYATTRRFYYRAGADQFRADAAAIGGAVKVDGADVVCTRQFAGGVQLVLQVAASEICEKREVLREEYVLPEDLSPDSDLAPTDTTAVTW